MRDEAMCFWLGYVEREGGLVEDGEESVLAVLPGHLRELFELTETTVVTSDPDVAREDGALLLIPGHPVLDAAAERVLGEGDVGTERLEWPRKEPDRDALVAAARAGIGVSHARIDPGGEPVPRWAPYLRVEVGVTYDVGDRFHEREEVWVDGRAGLAVPPDLQRALAGAVRVDAGGGPAHRALESHLETAVLAASALLEGRARRRAEALARRNEPTRRDELARAERFYEATLHSIQARRAGAATDRQALYDAQADSTRAERSRRLEEIREAYSARFEIRPVRLHLIQVPALQLPVVVHRGKRAFPLELTWILTTRGFAPEGCPSCGGPAPLVAAKDRLGCEDCTARELPAAPPPPELPAIAPQTPEPAHVSMNDPPVSSPAPAEAGPRPPLPSVTAERDRDQLRRRVVRAGNRLGMEFWGAVISGDSWPRKRADPHSPLRALYRLYGADAPLRAVGIPPGELPDGSRATTAESIDGVLHRTRGGVFVGNRPYYFTLRWRMEAGKPAVDEIAPNMDTWDARLPVRAEVGGFGAARLYDEAPAPRSELDDVAESLWRVERPRFGLALVARCLAAWWRVAGDPLVAELPAPVIAATIAAAVARRAGFALTRASAALDHGADEDDVHAAGRRLQALLGLSDARPW